MLAGLPRTLHDQFFGMQLDAVGFFSFDVRRCRFTQRQHGASSTSDCCDVISQLMEWLQHSRLRSL